MRTLFPVNLEDQHTLNMLFTEYALPLLKQHSFQKFSHHLQQRGKSKDMTIEEEGASLGKGEGTGTIEVWKAEGK